MHAPRQRVEIRITGGNRTAQRRGQLYQGGQYNLLRYNKVTEVRLVFDGGLGRFFGGDPKTSMSSYHVDMAVRVYENDKTVKVAKTFKWSKAGAKAGEWYLKRPSGSTSRLSRGDSTRCVNIRIPGLRMLEDAARYVEKLGPGEEQNPSWPERADSIENAIKVLKGKLAGSRPGLWPKLKTEEHASFSQH